MFTKYEQFKHNIEFHLQDHPEENLNGIAADIIADRRFQDDYRRPLGKGARFVQLESAFRAKCLGYYVQMLL